MTNWRSEDIFDRLVAPIGRDRFFADYWDRRACFLPGPRDRFADLFDRASFDRAAAGCGALKATFFDEKGWLTDVKIAPGEIAKRLAAGMTICAGILPETGALASFLAAYRGAIHSAGIVAFNSYLSPDGHGFGLHFDNHPVWILQIAGVKRWRFSVEPAVANPIVNVTMPPDRDRIALPWATIVRPAAESLHEARLEPGDILYLPAGCWHEARAEGGSLALTLAASPAAAIELVRLLVARRAAEFPALFARLPAVPAEATRDGAAPPEIAQPLRALREGLVGFATALSDEDLLAAWREAVRGAGRNQP